MELKNVPTTTSPAPMKFADDSLEYRDVVKNVTESYESIIPDEFMWAINIYFYILVIGAMSFFGTTTNVINIIIFYRLGMKDSMSVCLFALSITDSLVSAIIMIGRVCPIWDLYYDKEGIDPMALFHIGPAWAADSLYLCSGWILTFMSIERCVCVVFPFKVKQIFTRNRSIVAVVAIHVITASTYIPIYATHWLGWDLYLEVTPRNGTSIKRRLVVMFADNRKKIGEYVAIFSSAIIPAPSLVLTFVSVLWMIYGLNLSTKVRESMTAKSTDDDGDKASSKLTQKTRKLVIVVLLLAIVFLVCSVPRIIGTCIQIIYPEINEGGKERNLNNFIWHFARLGATLNAFINIFIYLRINSPYQDKFRELFPCIKI